MAEALFIIPLTVLPLIVFNIVAWIYGPGAWDGAVFGITMVSQQQWTLSAADLMSLFGIACLFGEVLKSTNTGARAIYNHILSMLIFIIYLVEFIVVAFAAKSVFFILMILALFDVLAGFTISIKAARRDLSVGRGDGV